MAGGMQVELGPRPFEPMRMTAHNESRVIGGRGGNNETIRRIERLAPDEKAVLTHNDGSVIEIGGKGQISVGFPSGEARLIEIAQQIKHIVVPHIAKTIYPALANFFIVVLVMGTSIGAIVGVNELTGEAITIATENYRWLEMFIVVAVIYVVLTFVASVSLALLGRWAFRVQAKIF